MSQADILVLLHKNPRLTTHDISRKLGINIIATKRAVYKMAGVDIEVHIAEGEERERLLAKYPTLKFSPQIRVFTLKDDK